MSRSQPSSSYSAARSDVGITWTALTGSPLSSIAAATTRPSARFERNASEPPRRMTALAVFRHSAAASVVTLGRDS